MLDQIATNFLVMALSVGDVNVSIHNNFDLNLLGGMFIPWGRVTVNEIASGKKTSDHEWEQKQKKFNFFKDQILKCNFFDTTLFVVRKDNKSPSLLIDGVHRALGVQKAVFENPNIKAKINLRILLIESPNMNKLEDYKEIL